MKVAGGGPSCVQYEVTGGSRGPRYQVDVVLEAGGRAFDGYAGFGTPREASGFWVYDADDLSRHGTAMFQPES
ncbi:MAG TPA: hypothetical protein VGX28_08465 [Frankiaceae bacterium]|nr:hypothetical protein [Frankiaceae bacterium]